MDKKNQPPADWPDKGTLIFKHVKLRYRENLPLALKGVSFDVLPKEKIGIVGRSGSGTLILNLTTCKLQNTDSLHVAQRENHTFFIIYGKLMK